MHYFTASNGFRVTWYPRSVWADRPHLVVRQDGVMAKRNIITSHDNASGLAWFGTTHWEGDAKAMAEWEQRISCALDEAQRHFKIEAVHPRKIESKGDSVSVAPTIMLR